jgi:hypothetical protein
VTMSREEEIRVAALTVAARGAVNVGTVIQNAKRFAHYIETGLDVNEVPVVVPSLGPDIIVQHGKQLHFEGCAFLDSRGFCTCGADPGLMPVPGTRTCDECPHLRYDHREDGCVLCLCHLTNQGRRSSDVR